MKSMHDAIREHIVKGYTKAAVCKGKQVSFKALLKSEWSPRFEQLMRNRLIQGCFRYGAFAEKRKKFNYDTATEAITRIERYQKDGNVEHLVDAANMCLLEFEFGKHPKKHFKAVDDGKHAQERSTHD